MKGWLTRLAGWKTAETDRTITVVSGLPRSGTSLMMGMLEAGGFSIVSDSVRIPDTDNPNGYYEFERVKKLPKGDVAWLADAEGKVVKVISMLLKHLPATHSYRVVFMERKMSEILTSQRKMIVHRKESVESPSDEEMSVLYGKHLSEVKSWLAEQPNFTVCYINYNKMLENASSIIHELNIFCGGNLQTEAMRDVIDPKLYRNKV